MPQTPEHSEVRLPLVERLVALGWKRAQIQFAPEWRVPRSPHEASKRELGQSFDGFPVDLVIFDEPRHAGDPDHVLVLIETKAPGHDEGVSQLQAYMSLEPQAKLGLWTNGTDVAAVHRAQTGRLVVERKAQLPRPDDALVVQGPRPLKWDDLEQVDAKRLQKAFQRLLEHVVSADVKSTRRDEQLNQLCNLLLIKLESDRKAKIRPQDAVVFQVWADEAETDRRIRELYDSIRLTHSDLFSAVSDTRLELDSKTVHRAAFELAAMRLVDTPIDAISFAFQVFRSASLKSEEGQYFTPAPVIRSAVKLMEIQYDDKIIDPSCGTGGFLIECFKQLISENPAIESSDAKPGVCTPTGARPSRLAH